MFGVEGKPQHVDYDRFLELINKPKVAGLVNQWMNDAPFSQETGVSPHINNAVEQIARALNMSTDQVHEYLNKYLHDSYSKAA